jgi:hypothetical protein
MAPAANARAQGKIGSSKVTKTAPNTYFNVRETIRDFLNKIIEI